MTFRSATRKARLHRVEREVRGLRLLGVNPYGYLSGSDLQFAINNGLMDEDRKEQPYHDDGHTN